MKRIYLFISIIITVMSAFSQSHLNISLKDISNDTTIKKFKLVNLNDLRWVNSDSNGQAIIKNSRDSTNKKYQISHVLYETVILEVNSCSKITKLTLFTRKRKKVDNSGKRKWFWKR